MGFGMRLALASSIPLEAEVVKARAEYGWYLQFARALRASERALNGMMNLVIM